MLNDLTQQPTDTQPLQPTEEQKPIESPAVQEQSPQEPVQPPPIERPITPPSENQPTPSESPQPIEPTPLILETPVPQTPESPPSSPVTPISQTESVPIPQFRFPFNGNFPLTFPFGAPPTNEEIKKKFLEWGIIGHHGLDFALPQGSEILSVDFGKVIQSGDNGDFGISVTIQHPWGQSLYAHLKEIKVSQDQEVKAGDPIGISGQTGVAFGEHVHFGIKPNNFDLNNGYLGFIDPTQYLPPIQSPQVPQSPQEPQPQIIEKEVIKEIPVEKIVEKIVKVPVVNQEEVQKLAEEKIKANWQQYQSLGNKAKQDKKRENLNKIIQLAQTKKQITNQDIRDFLHVSQSTATAYLTELVSRGMLKIERRSNQTIYSF